MPFLFAQETALSCKQRKQVAYQDVKVFLTIRRCMQGVCKPSKRARRRADVVNKRTKRREFVVCGESCSTATLKLERFLVVYWKFIVRLCFLMNHCEKRAMVDEYLALRFIWWPECMGKRAGLRCVSATELQEPLDIQMDHIGGDALLKNELRPSTRKA